MDACVDVVFVPLAQIIVNDAVSGLVYVGVDVLAGPDEDLSAQLVGGGDVHALPEEGERVLAGVPHEGHRGLLVEA